MNTDQFEEVNRAKLKHLSDKIKESTLQQERTMSLWRESLQGQIQALQAKVQRDVSEVGFEFRINQVKQGLHQVGSVIQSEIVDLECEHSRDIDHVKELEEIVQGWVEEQRQKHKEPDQGLEMHTASRLNTSTQNIRRAIIDDNLKFNQKCETVNQDTLKLNRQIEDYNTTTQQSNHTIVETIQTQLNKFEEAIATETQMRLESESKIRRMIEQIRAKLKEEIGKQRLKREQLQRNMWSLVEAACDKLETRLSRSRRHL